MGYTLLGAFALLGTVLALSLTAWFVGVVGDQLGLWHLPDQTTCEANR